MSLIAAVGLAMQIGGDPAILWRAPVDPRRDVNFHAIARPDTVYVGEVVNYELGVFISDGLRQRLRRNPEFVPPELRSVLAYDLRERVGSRIVQIDNRTYEVFVFRRALFPVTPGRIVVPRARLTYTVPLGPSFFSREETRTLESESVSFVAIPPPMDGRPDSWTGAVGNVTLGVSIANRAVRVGDPAIVTLRVTGAGNVHLWPRPEFDVDWGTVVPGSERVLIDSLATGVRGTKEFEFLVTPTAPGRAVIPAVSYTFFDPVAAVYRTVRSRPAAVNIGEGELVALDTSALVQSDAPIAALRPSLSRQLPESPDRSWWYWVVFLLAPIPVVANAWRGRERRRVTAADTEALGAIAIRRGATVADVQVTLKRALERRLGVATLSWADAKAVRRELRYHGVTDATADATVEFLSRLDRITYGADDSAVPDAGERALTIFRAVDGEAQRAGGATSRRRHRSAAAFVVVPAIVALQAGTNAETRFADGIAAFAEGDPAGAAGAFFDAARSAPAATSAWVNAGIASWEAADTARAVVAWQRALRLDPLDGDVRDHLARVGADAGSGRSAVWPLPRRALAWVALLLWVGAWMHIWRVRGGPLPRAMTAAGALLAAVSFVHGQRLNDDSLAVIARTTSLRMLPALGADAGPAPLTGEIVHVRERAGLWVRVDAAGGRDGWIDGARVLGLDGRPLRD